LQVERISTAEILGHYGVRLRHVHLHDNKGGHADLHLALGAGNIDVAGQIALLKQHGYDGTITLEVFSPDRHFLAYSRDRLRELWNSTRSPAHPIKATESAEAG
jgi:sugar phosphate isomerase/epimerase